MQVKFFDEKNSEISSFDCGNFDDAQRLAESVYWTKLEFEHKKYSYINSILSAYGYIKVYVKKDE